MEVKPGYKQTEVGVIPEDWEVKPLSAVSSMKSGEGITASRIDQHSQYPCYGGNGLRGFTSRHTHDGAFALIGRQGALCGNVVGVSGKFFASEHAVVVTARQGTNIQFLTYVLGEMRLNRLSEASAQPGLSVSKILQLSIGTPPTEAGQRAIAEALSDVDALLGALDRLIAKKRDLKQAAMQQLLTGQTRLPGFHGKWEVKTLGELARIQRGASPRPIESPVWFDENSSIGWVRISDVTKSGMFLIETVQRLSPLGVEHSRPVEAGSLIMSICATVGRPIITEIDVCIHDGFVVFDKLQADKFFIYYVLKWIEPDWSKHGQTGSQMNLNTGLINGTRIELPPTPEQTAIAAVLTDMDAELAALEQRQAKTRALKQGMMQELLTGRIRLV
ncbi:MAG TPA: restriction endonuclease subunit S [Pyrinomonadaceae bacterium]|nr:restriction endonuclease subunit S [Pyrinomonadaceae bacterium]